MFQGSKKASNTILTLSSRITGAAAAAAVASLPPATGVANGLRRALGAACSPAAAAAQAHDA
jgi:hypothetical protein